jgi:5-methylcytosine-specific restriction protein B
MPFYKELAEKILAYRDRQGELIALLKELKDAGIPVISLDDKAAKNKTVPLSTIDPFTFFAAFNRKATDQNRKTVLAKIKERLQMQAAVPTDFDGIPVMHPMMSRFLPWQYEQQADDLASLWAFAEAAVTRAPDDIPPELFNRCLQIHCVSVTNLTMGMFWMRPDT